MNSQCVLCLDRLVNVTGWYLPFYYHRPIVNVSLAVNLINLQNHLLFCLVDRVLWFFFFLNLNFNWKQITERKYFIYWCHNIFVVVYSFYLQHCKNIRIECSDQNDVYIYTSVGKLLSAPPPKKKKRLQNKKQKRQIYKGLWVYYFDAVQVTFVKIYKVFIAWGGRYTIYVRVDAQGY